VILALPAQAAPELEQEASLDVLLGTSPARAQAPRRTDPAPMAVEAQVAATWLWTLDSGLQPGIALGARAVLGRTDDGLVSQNPALCAPVPACRLPAAVLSHTQPGAHDSSVEAEAVIDRAALVVRGGWGEVQLGRTAGAAFAVEQVVPGLTALAGRSQGSADLVGIGQIAAPGLSGSAAKLSVVSTRLVGLRAALSYAPQTDSGALDGPPDRRALGGRVEAVWEAGIEAALRQGGVEIGLGLSHAQASLRRDAGQPLLPARQEISQSSVTARLDGERWRTGLALRSGDQSGVLGAYQAGEISAVVEAGGWSWMAAAGQQSEPDLGVRTRRVSVMAGYPLREGIELLAGVTSAQRRVANGVFPAPQSRDERRSALVMGLSITY
jgi:predicted porin